MPHKLRPPSSLPMTADGSWKTRSPSLAERQDQPQQRTTTTETSAFGQVTESHSSFARVPPEKTSFSASSSMTSRPSFSAPKQRPPSRIGSAQQLTSVEPHHAPACMPASVNDESSRRWSLGIDVASLSSTAAPVVVDQNRNPQLQTAHYMDTEATRRRSFSDLCDIVAVVADVTPLDMNHPGGTRQRPHHRDRQWVRTPTTATTTTGSHTAAGAKALNHPQPVQEAAASASLTTDRCGHPTPMTSGNRRASSPVSDPLTRLMRRVAERERMAPPPLTEPTVVPDGSSCRSPSTRPLAAMGSPCPASSDSQKQFPSTDHLRSPWGGMSNYNDHHAISQHASTDITTTTPLRASSSLTAKEGTTLAASNEAQTALAIALSVLREGSTHRTPRHAFYQPTQSSSSSSHQLPLPPPSSFVPSHVVASPSFAVAGASPIVYASPLTPPRHHHQGHGGVSQKRSLYQDIDLAADAAPHHYNGILHENRYDPDSLPQHRSTWTSPRLAS